MIAPDSPPTGIQPRLLAGLLGLTLMTSLDLNTVPLINGVWTERLHYDPATVGFLLTLHLMTSAGVSIAVSSNLHRIEPRRWGVIAGTILVAANLWLAFHVSYWALLGACVVAGAALGILTACGVAALATTGQVDRHAARTSIAATFLVAAFTVPIAHLGDTAGPFGLFLTVAAVALIAATLTSFLPIRTVGRTRPRSASMLRTIGSPFVFSAIFLELGTAGIWAFSERIGASIGLVPRLVGDVIALATLFGLAGAVSAAFLARPGRELPLAVLASLLFGLAGSAVAIAPNQPLFVTAMSVQVFVFVLSGPFITAVGISIDRSGGLATAAHGWAALLGAFAPMLAGLIAGTNHFGRLAALCAVATALSVAMLVRAAKVSR